MKSLQALCLCAGLLCCVAAVTGQTAPNSTPSPQPKPKSKPTASTDPGENVFRHNCSRCHYAPEQLSPRISGTVLQHMRIRANLSAADQKLLLNYLAP